uniref:Ig-like domain-containing protein n=1 Tax=Paramormyrops kingsleyae TaxID=1676925 RepID=A0A3B3RR95_9TELE
MLFTLYTFITALAYISGQRIVTQKPSLLTLSKGETATLHCQKPEDDYSNIYWYKQVPGGAPQFVLYYYRTHSSPTYGSGFSSSRFTSRAQSNTDYQLVISSVEVDDSAVYYCKNWFSNEAVSQ